MKVALVHYWLVGMRGGEKVLEALCDLFPHADIFTHVYDPDAISDTITKHTIRTTFIQRLPFSKRLYKKYLPLMPLALEQLDLTGYDLVISSESGPAKGVITHPSAKHICYCHTPMRYLWDMYHRYRKEAGHVTSLLMPFFSHYLRLWDQTSASRVEHFIANSSHVAARIKKYYRREAQVIHPPVNTDDFYQVNETGEYYLFVGQLVGYKRAELAIQAFNVLKKPLVVIGEGEQYKKLQAMAGSNITLMGQQPFSVLQDYYARCKALIFPGEEDFGIIPVEAMASGRPVIAYKKGGALETVVDGKTGIFFDEQSVDALIDAVIRFEKIKHEFCPETIVSYAKKFDAKIFKKNILDFINTVIEEQI